MRRSKASRHPYCGSPRSTRMSSSHQGLSQHSPAALVGMLDTAAGLKCSGRSRCWRTAAHTLVGCLRAKYRNKRNGESTHSLTHTYIHTHTHSHTQTHSHSHILTHTHTHTHTQTQTNLAWLVGLARQRRRILALQTSRAVDSPSLRACACT